MGDDETRRFRPGQSSRRFCLGPLHATVGQFGTKGNAHLDFAGNKRTRARCRAAGTNLRSNSRRLPDNAQRPGNRVSLRLHGAESCGENPPTGERQRPDADVCSVAGIRLFDERPARPGQSVSIEPGGGAAAIGPGVGCPIRGSLGSRSLCCYYGVRWEAV